MSFADLGIKPAVATLNGTSRQELLKSLLDTGSHGLLTLTNPDARIVLLLVGLVSTLGVTNLGAQVVNVVSDEVTDTGKVSPLEIRV